MKKKRIALAGCRGHVEKFGRLINECPEAETVAVWDNVPGRGEKVAQNLNIPFEPDYERLLREYALDGVVIPAENSLHYQMVTKAAEAGVAVFLEKPLCIDLNEAYGMAKAVKESGIKFYMTDPFVRRGTLKLKELIDSGVLGEITGATFRLGSDGALKGFVDYERSHQQGGIMADVGGHMLHKAHFLFGKPSRLAANLFYYTPQARANGIEEKALITMEYGDGKTVSLECSWLCGSRGSGNIEMIYGTKGSAAVYPSGEGEGNEKVVYQLSGEAPVTLESWELPENPTRHVKYFVQMLARDLPNEIVGVDPLSNSGVSIDHAVEYVQILNAIYKNANKGICEI